MEAKTVEIVPHEQGWAILLGGVTTKVAPTHALAACVARTLVCDGERQPIWVLDSGGISRPLRAKAIIRTEEVAVLTVQGEAPSSPPDVVLAEPVAVPANIHGQDLREMQGSQA